MNNDRRKVLKGTGGMAVMGLAVSAGLFKPGSAWAQALEQGRVRDQEPGRHGEGDGRLGARRRARTS